MLHSLMSSLFVRQEEVLQTQARPMDRTRFRRKPHCLTLNAPAETIEEPFLLAFDQKLSVLGRAERWAAPCF